MRAAYCARRLAPCAAQTDIVCERGYQDHGDPFASRYTNTQRVSTFAKSASHFPHALFTASSLACLASCHTLPTLSFRSFSPG